MARRTFAEYKAEVEHALGNSPSDGITSAGIVTDAMNTLCMMRPWKWRRGGPVTADLTADQEYVELPVDFGELVTIEYPGTVLRGMIPTTVATIERLRASTVSPSLFGFYYAVNIGNIDENAPEDGLSVPTLELYPTPSSTVADALRITYLRDVPELEDDDDMPQIPVFMDRALALLCRAIAHELEDDEASSAARKAFDTEIVMCMRRDGGAQTRYGVASGGLFPRAEGVDPFYPSSIGDPS
jgi:hypothetical protein